jgi:hypothetical protein
MGTVSDLRIRRLQLAGITGLALLGIALIALSQASFASRLSTWNGAGVARVHLASGTNVVYDDWVDPLGEGGPLHLNIAGPGPIKGLTEVRGWNAGMLASAALELPLRGTVPEETFFVARSGEYRVTSPYSQGLRDSDYTLVFGPPIRRYAFATFLGGSFLLAAAALMVAWFVQPAKRRKQRSSAPI